MRQGWAAVAKATGIRIEGVEALKETLNTELPGQAHNLLRVAIFNVAKRGRDMLKNAAPVRTGRLRMSLKARRNRGDRNTVSSDVIFETGKQAKADGFYWRFLEHGTVKTPAQPFVAPVVAELGAAMPGILTVELGRALEKALARKAKRDARKAAAA